MSATQKRPSNRAVTRLPKTRTKTGCFTCRKRKKKCDEHGPVCQGCARNFLKCVWPSYPTETLPKDFELSTCTDDNFDALPAVVQSKEREISSSIPVSHSCESNKNTNNNEKHHHDNDYFDEELLSIPAALCSVMELKKYKHEMPYPTTVMEIPESIDFLIDVNTKSNNDTKYDNTVNPATNNNCDLINDETYVDPHTISQMFNSLYNKSVDIASSSSPESFYDDLLSYNPKTSYVTNSYDSIKNPIIASFREIFFARGCMYLSKNDESYISTKYTNAANKHYNNSINIIKNAVDPKSNSISENWMIFSMKTLCMADRLLGLVSENCITNLISIENDGLSYNDITSTLNGLKECSFSNFDKVLFSEVLFIYPFLIYFSKFDSLLEILPPSKLFQNYNKEMVEIFLNKSQNWLDDVLNTAMINIMQNLIKMMWILRMKNSIETDELNSNLKQLKTDISLIWTTIQTAEIQFDKESSLIDFTKLSHMSSEILFLAINNDNNNSISSTSPIIGFYMDQFMGSYESYLKNSQQSGHKIAKCFFLLPLFIAACSAQTLYQKEFISKEMYLISHELGHDFIESLTSTIEDCWCSQQNGGMDTLNRLITRNGFSKLGKV